MMRAATGIGHLPEARRSTERECGLAVVTRVGRVLCREYRTYVLYQQDLLSGHVMTGTESKKAVYVHIRAYDSATIVAHDVTPRSIQILPTLTTRADQSIL